MDGFVTGVLTTSLSSVPAALFALWLSKFTDSRSERKRLREYRRAPDGHWQAWRDGLYDIRDWAGATSTYLVTGRAEDAQFSMIRVPGHHYLAHMVRTGRIPAEQLQNALILREYCELLCDALAHVLAMDLDRPAVSRARPDLDQPESINAAERTAEAALIRLASDIEQMARDLLDPELAAKQALLEFSKAVRT
jgi:hypothetical protein